MKTKSLRHVFLVLVFFMSLLTIIGTGGGGSSDNDDKSDDIGTETGFNTDTGPDTSTEADYTNSLGMTFNLIPSGTFMMGSPEDEPGRSRTETQHEVTLTIDFYLQTTEVTQGQWESVVTAAETAGYLTPDVLDETPSFMSDCSNCPVQYVSWDEVAIFITTLNQFGEGTYSLPTEAQWEYAARAGSTTAFANGEITEYSNMKVINYDANLDAMGWYIYNDGTYAKKQVAQKQANDWGLYDMHGNVNEWCSVTDPTGPTSGLSGAFRGGSSTNYAKDCRSAYRGGENSDRRSNDIGFRLMREP